MALRNSAPLSGSLLAAHRPAAGHASQSAAAYAELRHRIITLRLPPATSIDEAALQSELGLGRTPIREALQRLSHENLVVILPRRGTLVADLNLSDLHKIFELRLELEPLAADLAARRASPQQIAALDDLFDLNEQGLDARRLIDIDHQAHQLIAAAAQNEFLAESLDRLYSHVLRLWHLTIERVPRLGDAVAEHREITGAIRDRAPERAARLMRAHVAGFQDDVLQAQSGWPGLTLSRKIS